MRSPRAVFLFASGSMMRKARGTELLVSTCALLMLSLLKTPFEEAGVHAYI